MAKTGSRVLITLVCTECKERNYHSQKIDGILPIELNW